jgi:hypothetical protein
VAFNAAAIFAPLMLQKPAGKSSYRENAEHLSRRLELWDQGNFRELVREGQTCQDRLRAGSACSSDDSLARRFATKVFNGSFKGAMSLLSDKGKGGVLLLNARTTKEMQAKHPKPAEPLPESLITGHSRGAVYGTRRRTDQKMCVASQW